MASSSKLLSSCKLLSAVRRIHPGRVGLILAGMLSILLALCFPMQHTATLDVLPALRDTKITLAAGQTLTQPFQSPSPFSQLSLVPAGLAKAKELTLEISLLQGETASASMTLPLSAVKNNARIKLDFPVQSAGDYTLILSATGTGEVKFNGSVGFAALDGTPLTAAAGIRLLGAVRLFGTFPVYLGCLLLLISLTPIPHRPSHQTRAMGQPSFRTLPRWVVPAALAGIVPALALAIRPDWIGIQWQYPHLLEGDLAAAFSLWGIPFHGALFTMVLATWCTAVFFLYALTRREVALHQVVLILILGGGILMGVCRPMLFEVGFDEGQHRQVMDQFAGKDAFSFTEMLYFSSSWNVGLMVHTLGRGLGTLMGLSAPWGYRLGGLLSLLAYGGMACAAVRILPKYKGSMALFALWPTNVFLAVTTTYDSLIIGGILLGAAIVLREIHRKDQPLSLGNALLLLTLLSLCTLAKSAYSLVLLLPLLLPKEKFIRRKSRLLFRGLVVLIALFCTMGRVVETTVLLTDGRITDDLPRNLTAAQSRDILLSGDDRMEGTSSADQLNALKASPMTGIQAMGKLLLQTLPQQSLQMAAAYGYFGGDGVALWIWLGLLLLPPLMEGKPFRLGIRRRLALLGLSLLPLAVLGGLMLVTSTPPGSTDIVGMQPRYILPVVPLIVLALSHPLRLPEAARPWLTRIVLGLAGLVLLSQGWIHLFLPFYT